MAEEKLIISPKTKIGELLDAYPGLEQVLIEMSPVFEKLKNPVLRRTVARVATIQQVAVVGGIPAEQIITRLRIEVGQNVDDIEGGSIETSSGTPSWYDEKKITVRYNATPVINSGDSPMNEVLRRSASLKPGEIFELQSPFVPEPVLDILRKKEFLVWTVKNKDSYSSYILRHK
ncbi:MAG TPA: DUF1858 domain-containing protein [Bacteroidales bacterium]|nr:DUF1858 domain-containing protein [Bacteroidales bacterium]